MKKFNFSVMKENANPAFTKKNQRFSPLALASFLLVGSCPGLIAQAHPNSFERLPSFLAATPDGGWAKPSTGFFLGCLADRSRCRTGPVGLARSYRSCLEFFRLGLEPRRLDALGRGAR